MAFRSLRSMRITSDPGSADLCDGTHAIIRPRTFSAGHLHVVVRTTSGRASPACSADSSETAMQPFCTVDAPVPQICPVLADLVKYGAHPSPSRCLSESPTLQN